MAKKNAQEVADLCREYGAEVLTTLVEVMRNSQSDMAKIKAASMIWDRAYGNQKGEQPTGEQMESLPTDERIRVLTAALSAEKEKLVEELAEGLTGAGPQTLNS